MSHLQRCSCCCVHCLERAYLSLKSRRCLLPLRLLLLLHLLHGADCHVRILGTNLFEQVVTSRWTWAPVSCNPEKTHKNVTQRKESASTYTGICYASVFAESDSQWSPFKTVHFQYVGKNCHFSKNLCVTSFTSLSKIRKNLSELVS